MEEKQGKPAVSEPVNYSLQDYNQPPQYGQPPQYAQPPNAPVQGMWAPGPVMTQPMTTMNTTTIINNQPAAPTVQLPRIWSTGICDMCSDIGVCCMVMFCGVCAECQLATDMGENCCLPLCVPGWLITLRTKMRTQYNIQGSVCDDCSTICFCGPCVLCQMMRELKLTKTTTVVGR